MIRKFFGEKWWNHFFDIPLAAETNMVDISSRPKHVVQFVAAQAIDHCSYQRASKSGWGQQPQLKTICDLWFILALVPWFVEPLYDFKLIMILDHFTDVLHPVSMNMVGSERKWMFYDIFKMLRTHDLCLTFFFVHTFSCFWHIHRYSGKMEKQLKQCVVGFHFFMFLNILWNYCSSVCSGQIFKVDVKVVYDHFGNLLYIFKIWCHFVSKKWLFVFVFFDHRLLLALNFWIGLWPLFSPGQPRVWHAFLMLLLIKLHCWHNVSTFIERYIILLFFQLQTMRLSFAMKG